MLRPGGTAFVIDNDATRSTFGALVPPVACRAYDPRGGRAVLGPAGLGRERIDIRWDFDSREDLRVGRADRVPARRIADGILAEHEGTGVDYAVNLWWRTFA